MISKDYRHIENQMSAMAIIATESKFVSNDNRLCVLLNRMTYMYIYL